MNLALVLFCIWVVLASVIAMMPRRFHWPGAAVLIGLGIPLLGLVTLQAGPVWGLVALAGGISVLRWPVLRAAQWIAQRLQGARDRVFPGEAGAGLRSLAKGAREARAGLLALRAGKGHSAPSARAAHSPPEDISARMKTALGQGGVRR